jgi:hypothetical protein
MTNKINLVINLSILALLIYLAVSVKTLQDKVMIPLSSSVTDDAFRDAIKNLLIQKLQEVK